MGIVLLTIALLIISIIGAFLAYKYYWASESPHLALISIIAVIAIIFFAGVMFWEIVFIGVNQGKAQNTYNQMLYTKEVLEYRLESGELQGNELLYKDITEYNNKVRSVKYYYNNLWTSWFFSGKVASIDYIEIPSEPAKP